MAYKCLECGHIFEDGEEAVWVEDMGEFFGAPCNQTLTGCPVCKSDYEKTVRCDRCGAYHLEDELEYGLCGECVEELKFEYKYSPTRCFNLARDGNHTEKVEINGFLAAMFGANQIEEILFRELISSVCQRAVDCSPYINADESWFIENAVKGVNKNENKDV